MTESKGQPSQPDEQPSPKEPELNQGTLPDLDPSEATDDVRGGQSVTDAERAEQFRPKYQVRLSE